MSEHEELKAALAAMLEPTSSATSRWLRSRGWFTNDAGWDHPQSGWKAGPGFICGTSARCAVEEESRRLLKEHP